MIRRQFNLFRIPYAIIPKNRCVVILLFIDAFRLEGNDGGDLQRTDVQIEIRHLALTLIVL